MSIENKDAILHMFANVAIKLSVIKSIAQNKNISVIVEEAQLILEKIWEKIEKDAAS